MARRLLTITGIGPLGVFLLVHLVVNARALRGEEAFTAAAGALRHVPAMWLVEVALVYAPLVERDPYPRGVSIAMRATGVVALVFLVLHVRELAPSVAGPATGAGVVL